MRVVLDTSILVSATFWRGNPYRCLQAVEGGLCELVTSEPILAELRDKLVSKFKLPGEEAEAIVGRLRVLAHVVPLQGRGGWVHADPNDDPIVETAIVGGASVIVSGDHHLLDLESVEGVSIVTARRFVEDLNPGGKP